MEALDQVSEEVTLGKQGRIVVPASIRKELGLKEGHRIRLVVTNGALTITSRRVALENAGRNAGVEPWKPGDPSWADQLVADRRRDAASE
ncbi:MAG: AbrB/MazE/SpoVT family DNA-binding protein [Thermoleophilia bacterium]|nr:AbrB/MazE/SpoVT family DNA-binding protein [Thermoleophilia bacterium]